MSAAEISESDVREFRAQQRRLLRAMLAISRFHHRSVGLGSLELHIMQHLGDSQRRGEERPIAKELAETLRVDKAALSRAVATLVKQELVETTPHGTDARRQILSLTADGRELAGQLDEAAQGSNRALLEQVALGERLVMVEGLELYLGLIEQLLDSEEWAAAQKAKAPRAGAEGA